MTGQVEATGSSVDSAINAALQNLGATEDEVEIEILSEGDDAPNSNVRGQARVRVRFRDERTQEDHDAAREAIETRESLPAVPRGDAERQAAAVQTFLDGLMSVLKLDATVEVRPTAFGVAADVTGEDLAVLIGRHGLTLTSLTEICRAVAQRAADVRSLVVVDIERYLVRRRDVLQRVASKTAEKVRKTKREVALEPMPARDRKIVHDALSLEPGVRTGSEGVEPQRFVVVYPRA